MDDKQQLEQRVAFLERRLKTLEYTQRTLDVHINAIENSITFKISRWLGRPLLAAQTKLVNILSGTWMDFPRPDPYVSWVQAQSAGERPAITLFPNFVILLAFSGSGDVVEEVLASLRAQEYPHWDLYLYSETPFAVQEFLARTKDPDSRIHELSSVAEKGLAAAMNQAVDTSQPDYVIVLDQAGLLSPDALGWFANAVPADLIYSDEDEIDGTGRHSRPVFKPEWSPDLLLSCMYIGNLMAVSREAWERAGKFRQEYTSASGYDLALRITDTEGSVKRIARVLYHRSSASASARPATDVEERKAVAETLRRRDASAALEESEYPGVHQIRWSPQEGTRASLIICSRSAMLLDRCLGSIRTGTSYADYEIVVVQHLGHDDAALASVIARYGACRIPYSGPFNFSKMSNLGATAASGEVVIFLNDDTEPLEPSWMSRLIGQAERPEVGVVGARLLYPSGTLQHAGIAIGINDGCGHIGRGMAVELHTPCHWPWLQMTRDVAAVTGACLAIRSDLFKKLGGFAVKFPVNYNDTDLCLRVRQAGYRVVYDAGVALRHHECQTRGKGVVTLRERETWFDCWGDLLEEGDPFYSPNLTKQREDLSLSD